MVQQPKKPLPLIEYLNSVVKESDLILDIGCGTKVISSNLECSGVTTLDAWKPFVPDIWCDLMTIPKIPCENNSFEIVLMIDMIEHLSKDRGFALLQEAKRITNRDIYVLTPLWWDPNLDCIEDVNSAYYNNTFDKHLSLWTPDDFQGFERIESISLLKDYFFGVWRKDESK